MSGYRVRVQVIYVYELRVVAQSKESAEEIVNELDVESIRQSGNLLDVAVDYPETEEVR